MELFLKMFISFVLITLCDHAQAFQQWELVPTKSKIGFVIKSTLHEVNGQARDIVGEFHQEQDLINGVVDIDVARLITGNNARDKDMYKMFNSASYPLIHFAFDRSDISKAFKVQEGHINFLGLMSIHGITHPVNILSKSWIIDDELVCEGSFLIHLKDYQLKPPSFLNIIRVKDEVLVDYLIVFAKRGVGDENR